MGRMNAASGVARLFESVDPRAAPEDVRIAEAMVFASAEPLQSRRSPPGSPSTPTSAPSWRN